LLAEEGFGVSVFEEHPAIGRPVQCAGLVSKSGIAQPGVELGNSIVNEIRGAKIFSPGGQSITVQRKETVAYVIDRFLFDQSFYKRAKRLGCDIRLESKLLDVRANGLFMQTKGRGEFLKSQITVGADGANSIVRHSVFPGLFENRFVQAFQARVSGKFNRNLVELHFGEFAPGFFAWIVPESGEIARIGLAAASGSGDNPGNGLKAFLEKRLPEAKVLSKSGALIPIAPPAKELVSGSTLLVGDAAAQTKATTGGGIVFGLRAAQACAGAIAGNLKHRKPLQYYNKNLQPINRELALHWKIYSYIRGLRPEQFDSLIAKAKKAGIEEFLAEQGDMDRPSLFMRKMLLKPKMWGLLPAVLRAI
jgi:geranylgeranyl reductase family protein